MKRLASAELTNSIKRFQTEKDELMKEMADAFVEQVFPDLKGKMLRALSVDDDFKHAQKEKEELFIVIELYKNDFTSFGLDFLRGHRHVWGHEKTGVLQGIVFDPQKFRIKMAELETMFHQLLTLSTRAAANLGSLGYVQNSADDFMYRVLLPSSNVKTVSEGYVDASADLIALNTILIRPLAVIVAAYYFNQPECVDAWIYHAET